MARSLIPWWSRPVVDAQQRCEAIPVNLDLVHSGNRRDELVTQQELIDFGNPAPRFPICIVADASQSMQGTPIDLLNAGIRLLGESVREVPMAAMCTDIELIRVGRPFEISVPYTPAECFTAPNLVACGDTPLAEGILLAIKTTEERIQLYNGIDLECVRPLILLLSDGEPNRSRFIPKAVAEVRRVEQEGVMSLLAVGVNSLAARKLQQFSVRPTQELARLDLFANLFRWVSRHAIRVSQSMFDDEPEELDMSATDWCKRQDAPK